MPLSTYDRRKALHVCPRCEDPPAPGAIYCATHLAEYRTASYDRYHTRPPAPNARERLFILAVLAASPACPLCALLGACRARPLAETEPLLNAALQLANTCVRGTLGGHTVEHPHAWEATGCPGFQEKS